jgi:hypothetical protein
MTHTNLMYFPLKSEYTSLTPGEEDKLYERDALGDLKHALDLIADLRAELKKLHPNAVRAIERLLFD